MSEINSSDLVIPIGVDLRPEVKDEIVARRGPRRLVKLVPLPGGVACPAIWTSPVLVQDPDLGKSVTVIVLVSKSPPQTMKVIFPLEAYEKLPEVPVEW